VKNFRAVAANTILVTTCVALLAAGRARAATITGYVNDPTGDSTDFGAGLAALGGSVNTLNVGGLPTGTLNSSAFAGVTLAGTGSFDTVTFGVGPSNGNTTTPPLSTGEGPHAAASYIGDQLTPGPQTFTVSFDTPVSGAGIFLIDLFNPLSVPLCGGLCDDVTLQAFTGTDGTGTSLGTYHSAAYNFQGNPVNYLYFMGITSSSIDIGSIVLSQTNDPSGDVIGLGNILYGTGTTSAVPEPSSTIPLLTAMILLAVGARRKGCAANAIDNRVCDV
jgi:hypothetical protein